MAIILSHPYSSALFYWFAEMQGLPIASPKSNGHPYYRALFRDSPKAIDIALTSLVVFDEIVIPAVDAPMPDGSWKGEGIVPELSLRADWDPVFEAQALIESRDGQLEHDETIQAVLRRLLPNGRARGIELEYAIADMFFVEAYGYPILCSPGRMELIEVLSDLGIFSGDMDVLRSSVGQGTPLGRGIEQYADVTGIAFNRQSVDGIAAVKSNSKIGAYADAFKNVLDGLDSQNSAMIDAISDAYDDAGIRRNASGLFATVARSTSFGSLLPVVGPVLGGVSVAADVVSQAAQHSGDKASWYELSKEIERFQWDENIRTKIADRKSERLDDFFGHDRE